MIDDIKEELIQHAQEEFPNECCGVVIVFKGRYKYIRCKNTHTTPRTDFCIDEEDFALAEDQGEVAAICHSHTNSNHEFTQADLTSCELHGVPWILISLPLGSIRYTEPSGYIAPLIGREYTGGILDCYSLVRDYYKVNLNKELPDIERCDRWWAKGYNILTQENFKYCGFEPISGIENIQLHDCVVMQNNGTVNNHVAIYIGEGKILHHCYGRLSSRDVYGGMWLKNTSYILRHKDLC